MRIGRSSFERPRPLLGVKQRGAVKFGGGALKKEDGALKNCGALKS